MLIFINLSKYIYLDIENEGLVCVRRTCLPNKFGKKNSISSNKTYNMSYIFTIFILILDRWQIFNNNFLKWSNFQVVNSLISYLQWHMLTFSYTHELLYSQGGKVLPHLIVNKFATLSPLWVYSKKFKMKCISFSKIEIKTMFMI